MGIVVRDAVVEDFEAVTALLEELGRPKALGTPHEGDRRLDFERWLAAPDLFAFVAELDGDVVGFIDLVFVPRLNFDAPQAWVPDLIVTDRARSQGAGSALLARAAEVAGERGAFALSLESANWRDRAHAFYVREGMRDVGKAFITMLRDIDWPPRPPEASDPT